MGQLGRPEIQGWVVLTMNPCVAIPHETMAWKLFDDSTYFATGVAGSQARTRRHHRSTLSLVTKPRRTATFAAAVRFVTSSLLRMLLTWVIAVRGLMNSASAISLSE